MNMDFCPEFRLQAVGRTGVAPETESLQITTADGHRLTQMGSGKHYGCGEKCSLFSRPVYRSKTWTGANSDLRSSAVQLNEDA
jgi:hypothetical protein